MAEQLQTQLWITKGATVTHEEREYEILRICDINQVIAADTETGAKVLLNLGSVGPQKVIERPQPRPLRDFDILSVPDELWEIAKQRLEWIRPLLVNPYWHSKALAKEIAEKAGVSRATVYRWVAAYRSTASLSSLIPQTNMRGGKNSSRLLPEVEALIEDVFKNFYETSQKRSKAKTLVELRRRCSAADLPLPAMNTMRVRLRRTESRERTKNREGEAAAYAKHDPIRGTITDADWPLAILMIDHTLLPVMIVDDVHRKPIGRAWITLAIDVFSRVCLGMYLSLDAPSAMSAGQCIVHAILPKNKWLRKFGIEGDAWPFWGMMSTLHADNAREFRGDMLKAACREYDVDLHLRPVKKPRYGTHIERLMGTVSEELKGLKGATFSGPDEKGDYDSEGNACLTFDELEHWFAVFFEKYHTCEHKGIATSPRNKWREGLLGTKRKPGRGIPAIRTDEELLHINFMPFEERTIHDYGVIIDKVQYYSDVLRPYMNARDPEHPKESRKFRFRRDPRDICQLYFFDERAGKYYAIPYRDTSLPPVSIWELRKAQTRGKELGISPDDEKAIFDLITRQREIEDDAASKTKLARREQQRRKQHENARGTKKETMPTVHPSRPASTWERGEEFLDYDPDEIIVEDDD